MRIALPHPDLPLGAALGRAQGYPPDIGKLDHRVHRLVSRVKELARSSKAMRNERRSRPLKTPRFLPIYHTLIRMGYRSVV